jgi:hypothetical protein
MSFARVELGPRVAVHLAARRARKRLRGPRAVVDVSESLRGGSPVPRLGDHDEPIRPRKATHMNTAMVLHTPLALSTPPLPVRAIRVPAFEPKYVFGDSAPFPHDSDVIETIRRVVFCSVDLMRAHHAGLVALDSSRTAERKKIEGRAQLASLGETVRRALANEATGAVERTAARILIAARAAIEADAAKIDVEASSKTKASLEALEKARKDAIDTLAKFAGKHDLPGTRVDLRLVAQKGAYDVEAIVTTPYGLVATFRCDAPATHPWRNVRRVRDVDALAIALPREVGVFSKRLDVRKAKLDKLLLLGVSIENERGALLLGENEDAGPTFEVEIDGVRVRARETGDNAGDREPYMLSQEDAGSVVKVYRAIVEATRDLGALRGAMSEAMLDGKGIRSVEPATIADKMVRAIAPIAREIARRSGAAGELVLRRNVGAGRRDEVYVTAAELLESIRTLPPSMRSIFAPLALDDAPRSPRAPAPSQASYEELHDADIEAIPDRPTPTIAGLRL